MTQPTPLYRLIEAGLGMPLAEFVAERRQPTKSWQEIADEIKERTGEAVSRERLRQWFPELTSAGSSASA